MVKVLTMGKNLHYYKQNDPSYIYSMYYDLSNISCVNKTYTCIYIYRMSNICSLSMDNTHNNVEFGVLQKTSKQSLISIFVYLGRGGHLPPIPTPRSVLRPSIKGFALAYVTYLGCVRGQYHTNNEQTQSDDGVI